MWANWTPDFLFWSLCITILVKCTATPSIPLTANRGFHHLPQPSHQPFCRFSSKMPLQPLLILSILHTLDPGVSTGSSCLLFHWSLPFTPLSLFLVSISCLEATESINKKNVLECKSEPSSSALKTPPCGSDPSQALWDHERSSLCITAAPMSLTSSFTRSSFCFKWVKFKFHGLLFAQAPSEVWGRPGAALYL